MRFSKKKSILKKIVGITSTLLLAKRNENVPKSSIIENKEFRIRLIHKLVGGMLLC